MPSPSEALQPFSTVVVTGGSSGIGKSFIELVGTLTTRTAICNLSRRNPTEKFSPNCQKKLNHFPCDLTRSEDVARVAGELGEFLDRGAPPGPVLLINNSGVGAFGAFPEGNLARELEMVDLNVRAVVQLTGLLLPRLKARGGAIITVCSVMSFQPTPYSATYGASKAFALHWSLALNEELRGSGVRALAVCPGTTRTEFFRQAGLGDGAVWASLSMSSDEVAELALRALGAGRAQIVTGWKNKVYTFFGSKLPKPFSARVSGAVLKRFRLAGKKQAGAT